MERRAHVRPAVEFDGAAHAFHHLARNVQPQIRTAFFPGVWTVRLKARPENPLLESNLPFRACVMR